MKRSSLFLAIALAVLVAGVAAHDARAGGMNIPVPTALSSFVNPDGSSNGNYTTVQQPGGARTFSSFSYSTRSTPPPGSAGPHCGEHHRERLICRPVPPKAASHYWGFQRRAGMTVDFALSYVVTAPAGTDH